MIYLEVVLLMSCTIYSQKTKVIINVDLVGVLSTLPLNDHNILVSGCCGLASGLTIFCDFVPTDYQLRLTD